MAKVEISVDETGTLKVVQHYDLRSLLRKLRPDGSQRHRVATWSNCSCSFPSVPDSNLKFFILFILSFTLVNVIIFGQILTHETISWGFIIDQTWPFGLGKKGTILLAMFAAVVVVGVFVKKNTGSAAQRTETVQTVSALVQQV